MNRIFAAIVPSNWTANRPPSADPSGSQPNQPARRRGGAGDAPRPPVGSSWFVILILIVTVILALSISFTGGTSQIDYSFFKAQLEEGELGNVKSVKFTEDSRRITGEWRKPPADPADVASDASDKKSRTLRSRFSTYAPPFEDKDLLPLLKARQVMYTTEPASWGPGANILAFSLVTLVSLGLIFFLMRRSSDPLGPGGVAGSFIRSPAKRFSPSEQHNTFEDVAGMEQAKRELVEIVEFLKNPAKFQKLGAQIPKGVLLMGPPGTGKTLLARASAGEAGVPFFSINGSEFIQMFVGVGASRVRDMFRTAKENSPCILFIDEIDAVGRVRGAGVGGGHDEREQTLNQILSEMDGFNQTEAVIVLAATNRPDVLDPALLRPGRFDRHIPIDRPTREGRLGILKVHTRKVPLDDDVNLDAIAAGAVGFSGADLKNLVNEAALKAAREDKSKVANTDFDAAKDRVLMGPKREEIMNEKERAMTAYHEAGHALVAWLIPDLDPVHKVTIIPRGRALGVTQLLADEERQHIGEQRLHANLALAMGGRAAEKLIFDEYSAGAQNDIQQATDLSRRMIAHWGMSQIIGPVAFHQSEEHPFLGKEMHEARQFSEETAHIIDQEVQRFVNAAADRAKGILANNRDKLDLIAKELLKREELNREELNILLGCRPEQLAESA